MFAKQLQRCGIIWGLLAILLALVGCVGQETDEHSTEGVSPTIAPLFGTPNATLIPVEQPTFVAVFESSREDGITEIPIYDDILSENWTLANSWGMEYSETSTAYVDSGSTSIAARASRVGGLQFSLRPDTLQIFPRESVLGVSFRLSGGGDYMSNDALAVAVVGSNAYPYWVEGDTSVQLHGRDMLPDIPLFSETRLYYLDIRRDIPPETWVEVIVWLNDRQYDPQYTYVTGFYIKNDENYHNPFYIDNVVMLVSE